MSYLNETGLAYFWGKIKAWANSVFALIGHKHPSSDVNAMTGYSMPSSTGAISSGDTLNQAVGKLEKAVTDADISNVVHRTGNETIQGTKIFNNARVYLKSNFDDDTTPAKDVFVGYDFIDSGGDRLGSLEYSLHDSSNVSLCDLKIICCNPSNETDFSYLHVGFDKAGNKFAVCPTTSDLRSDDRDILTRNWIPKDARIVHTTGNEVVAGSKTFSDRVYIQSQQLAAVDFKYTSFSIPSLPSDGKYLGYRFTDNSGRVLVDCYNRINSSGDQAKVWALHDTKSTNTNKQFIYQYIANGDKFYLAGPADFDYTDDSGKIPNTAWLRRATGDFALNAATATKLATARTIRTNLASTSTASFDGSANITPGVTGTLPVANGGTGLTSLDTFVRTTGDQTVNGAKTFTSILYVERINPYVQLKETDTVRDGTAQSSSYAGFGIFDKNSTDIGGFYAICGDVAKRTTLRLRLYENKSSANTARDITFQWNVDGSNWFMPGNDNVINLGGNGNRWKQVYAATATISTSDERAKRSIGSVPDGVLDAWLDLDFLQFQFADAVDEKGDGARLHTGMVAQRVAAAFAAHGLDASRYGLFCHDSWEAEAASYSKDGKLIDPAREAGDRYSLRYEEALCMEAACMRRENARLKKRVADLEERLAALELRLGSA